MEFRDLKQQYQLHKKEIDTAIQSVLINADFIQGKKVFQLENALAEYVGVKHCITCANGTDALQLALMTWEIGVGDAVFVPDFTFFSSGEVVPLVGATPVFVDIDKETYNINPQSLETAIEYVKHHTNLNPKVIVAVDLFGQPADFSHLKLLAKKYGLLVLEDAAQGFGGKIQQKKHVVLETFRQHLFFQQSHWDVMEMEEQFLRTMMIGPNYFVRIVYMEREKISMTMCV